MGFSAPSVFVDEDDATEEVYMLVHHSAVPYEEAASAAAMHARSKLDALIEKGRQRAQHVFEAVQSQQPVDRLVRTSALSFAASHADGSSSGVLVSLGAGGDLTQRLHTHALHQAATRVALPWSYVQHLREQAGWGPALIAENLNELYTRASAESDERSLMRSVHDEVRGVLSSRYRRLDSRPLVDAFAKSCAEMGALPYEGYVTDTKIAIKAILPTIYEPVKNEVMCFGAVLENSDFGAGALSVRLFVVRLYCTNTAITDESIREVHLGARLPDDMDWSDRTHALDTRRMTSVISDVVRGQLSTSRIGALQAAIRAADADKVEPGKVVLRLRRALTKSETERAVEMYESDDVHLLPPGRTTWRLSNAVSWLAGTISDPSRKLELMKVAGGLLPKAS